MNLYALSDTHGNLNVTLPDDADLILHAGDICPNFRHPALVGRDGLEWERSRQVMWMESTFEPWVSKSNLIGTYGNHDRLLHGDNNIFTDCLVEEQGLKIWLSPWSPLFGKGWSWMERDEHLSFIYDAIPKGLDILISHGPPYGYGDTVDGAVWVGWNRDEDPHLGSKSLLAQIDDIHPKVIICGHIHTGHGRYEHTTPDGHDVVIYNVSLLDEGYNMTYPITKIKEFNDTAAG